MKIWLTLLVLLLASCQSAPPPLLPDFAFVRVNVIDVSTGAIAPEQTVMIRGNTIVAIGDFATTVIPKDVATVFAEGQYLMPGLTDSHVHAIQSVEAATARTLPLFVAHGVTHVRDMGTELGLLQQTIEQLEAAPGIIHPLVTSTGPFFDGEKLTWYGDLQLITKDTDSVAYSGPC